MDFYDLIDANGHAEIPEGTEKIPLRAFKECKSLKTITIPATVTDIQSFAFTDCTSLTSITIPSSVKRLGSECFAGCESLQKVVLPEGMTVIEHDLFNGCKNLQEIVIPEGVTQIGYGAFAYCRSLKEIVIPEGVTQIGNNAFCNCQSLQEIVIPDSVTQIGDGLFGDCISLTKAVIPDHLTSWGNLFQGCTSLLSVNLPKGMERIEGSCFYDCKSLKSVLLPDGLKEIGYGAFSGCECLESIELPDSLENIGHNAFKNCKALTVISIPPKIKEVACFSDCSLLREVHLPEGLEEIGWSAFSDCISLTSVVIPHGVKEIYSNAFNNCTSLPRIVLPEGITVIAEGLFSGCRSLEEVVIPGSVTTIEKWAFQDCSALKEIHIPEGVTSIPGNAFSGCKSVHIHIPSTVEVFETGDGDSYNEAKAITVSPGNKVFSVEENCLVDKRSRTLLLVLPSATAFPANLRSIRVHKTVFPPLYDVEELVIPDGVEYIDSLPFKQMTRLKTLHLPVSMKDCGEDFMNGYPLPEISVTPELLMAKGQYMNEKFRAWDSVCKVHLLGTDSAGDDLVENIKLKYKREKDRTGRLFWVYLNGENVYPTANTIKQYEKRWKRDAEEYEAEKERMAREALEQKKQEMADKMEDVTIASLCSATFGNNGFEYSYDDTKNRVEIIVQDGLYIQFVLGMKHIQEDLAFLLDVATSYRDALIPYWEASADPHVTTWYNSKKSGDFNVSGKVLPDTTVTLCVQSDTVLIAFRALENLAKAHAALKQKYGEKMDRCDADVR